MTPPEPRGGEGLREIAERVIANGYTNTAEYALAEAYLSSPPSGGGGWPTWQDVSRLIIGFDDLATVVHSDPNAWPGWRRSGMRNGWLIFCSKLFGPISTITRTNRFPPETNEQSRCLQT